jgi:DNA repair photolyase
MDSFKIIYEPKGRAREYSPLAVNVYRGCLNACAYCYAPNVLHMDRAVFNSQVTEVPNLEERLEHDLNLLSEMEERGLETGRVLLCFTTDLFQPIVPEGMDDDFGLVVPRKVIALFNKYGIPYNILTKNPGMALKMHEEIDKNLAWIGTTIATYDKELEPNSEGVFERAGSLQELKEAGFTTWVSFEPWLDEAPVEYIETIVEYIETISLVTTPYIPDFVRVGKVSRFPSKMTTDEQWTEEADKLVDMMMDINLPFYIKEDLRPHLKKHAGLKSYKMEPFDGRSDGLDFLETVTEGNR